MTAAATVLIDTSVWADHFRAGDAALVALLNDGRARMHPYVVGELAMGNIANRARTIALLRAVPSIAPVDEDAWLSFVEREELGGSGLGYVDTHLLAAAHVAGAALWTRDRRLAARAAKLESAWAG